MTESEMWTCLLNSNASQSDCNRFKQAAIDTEIYACIQQTKQAIICYVDYPITEGSIEGTPATAAKTNHHTTAICSAISLSQTATVTQNSIIFHSSNPHKVQYVPQQNQINIMAE